MEILDFNYKIYVNIKAGWDSVSYEYFILTYNILFYISVILVWNYNITFLQDKRSPKPVKYPTSQFTGSKRHRSFNNDLGATSSGKDGHHRSH